jgi:hypothetical protein
MRLRTVLTCFLVGALGLTCLIVSACGGDDDNDSTEATATSQPATNTPSEPTKAPPTTTTPTAEANTAAGFKAALQKFNGEISSGTVDPLVARLKVTDYTCKASDLQPGLGQPECATAGEVIRGFQSSSWRSEGGMRKVESIVTNLKERQTGFDPTKSDKYGTGSFRVYAFDASKSMAVLTVTSKCLPQFQCSDFQRLTWVAQFEFVNGRWMVSSLMSAFVLGEDFLDPSAEGKQRMPGWEKF